jgi:murein DD-endopeptidase MepM/ murein hydrolase activator NlpD
MDRAATKSKLPYNPNLSIVFPKKGSLLKKLSWKLALGTLCMFSFLSYQPIFGIPPIQKSIARAETEQTQQVGASSLPFTFQLPHPGYISTSYSGYHPGIDIASGLGAPIKPIARGVVLDTGYNFWGLGLTVTIDHGRGYKSLYAHLGRIYVQKGQEILENNFIGEIGMTGNTSGPHTHLEVYRDGASIDPIAVLPSMRSAPLAEDFKPVGGNYQSPIKPKPAPSQTPKPTPAPEVKKPVRLDLTEKSKTISSTISLTSNTSSFQDLRSRLEL